MTYLGNAFSLQMLQETPATLKVQEVSKEEVFGSNFVSVVGHQDTANILGVKMNRVSVTLKKGDVLYVAQLMGGRLPEGATQLPEGFEFKYLKVEIVD